MWHAWEIREIHAGVWWRNLGDWDHLEDLGVDRKIILKRILKWVEGGGLVYQAEGRASGRQF
jgi:hypothetical protein